MKVQVQVSDLIVHKLDWAVAKAEGWIDDWNSWLFGVTVEEIKDGSYHPSSDWSQAGPIIEREKIDTWYDRQAKCWHASVGPVVRGIDGPTPLIAAMRCYVASKLGRTVEIPD